MEKVLPKIVMDCERKACAEQQKLKTKKNLQYKFLCTDKGVFARGKVLEKAQKAEVKGKAQVEPSQQKSKQTQEKPANIELLLAEQVGQRTSTGGLLTVGGRRGGGFSAGATFSVSPSSSNRAGNDEEDDDLADSDAIGTGGRRGGGMTSSSSFGLNVASSNRAGNDEEDEE